MYQPTPIELSRFNSLRRRLILPVTLRSRYSAQVARWSNSVVREPITIRYADYRVPVVRFRSFGSELFNMPYLIGEVAQDDFRVAFPTFDACAIAMVRSVRGVPSLVAVPIGFRVGGSARRRAILEHECVHVNQILLGTHAIAPTRRTAAAAFRYFVDHMRCEYEATLLPRVQWPAIFTKPPAEWEVASLDHWCVFYAYVHTLESVLHHLIVRDFWRKDIRRLIRLLAHGTEDVFSQIGLDGAYVSYFAQAFPNFLAKAVSRVAEFSPRLKEVKNYGRLRDECIAFLQALEG